MLNLLDGIKSLTNKLINDRNVIGNNTVVSSRLSPEYIREIMKTGLANRVVSLKADFATKNGFNFNDDLSLKFYDSISREIKKVVFSMISYGRGIVVLIEPALPLSEPLLNVKNARVKTFTGDMVTVTATEFDVSKPDYMKPTTYIVRGYEIHPSRVVDFTYKEVSEYEAQEYHFGGIGEIELIHDQLINDGIVERASVGILEKSSTLYHKINGFKNALLTEKDDGVVKFVRDLEDLRSIHGSGIIDSEDDVTVISQALTNLAETDQMVLRRVALVTGIPYTLLIGESSSALSGTHETERDVFNEVIDSVQENYIIPPLTQLMTLMGYSEPSLIVGQNVSDKDQMAIDDLAIRNASGLDEMGEDPTIYLSKYGIIPEPDDPDNQEKPDDQDPQES
jgi:hypothetical protein